MSPNSCAKDQFCLWSCFALHTKSRMMSLESDMSCFNFLGEGGGKLVMSRKQRLV